MEKMPLLDVKNLYAGVECKEIIKGLNLTINEGEVHVIMGPNGAGKSTLAYVLTGKSDYCINNGTATFKGENLLEMVPEERARKGLFLSMQTPTAIPGVNCSSFLKYALNAKRKHLGLPELDAAEFLKILRTKAKELNISADMLKREINVGFSGGEKKRMEALQMSLLEPSLAILDETDSGLDVDAIKLVAENVNTLRNEHNAILIITHHDDLLQNIEPDFVHIYVDGHIIHTGDKTLATKIDKDGYGDFLKAE